MCWCWCCCCCCGCASTLCLVLDPAANCHCSARTLTLSCSKRCHCSGRVKLRAEESVVLPPPGTQAATRYRWTRPIVSRNGRLERDARHVSARDVLLPPTNDTRCRWNKEGTVRQYAGDWHLPAVLWWLGGCCLGGGCCRLRLRAVRCGDGHAGRRRPEQPGQRREHDLLLPGKVHISCHSLPFSHISPPAARPKLQKGRAGRGSSRSSAAAGGSSMRAPAS